MTLWAVRCQEKTFPGMWQRWYRNQCVGIGWPPQDGYCLSGDAKGHQGWVRARNAAKEINAGDTIIVALEKHRIGRIGEVTDKAIDDADWNALVPPSKDLPNGEMGRRIFVRWDLMTGPDSPDQVVQLPKHARLTSGELRPTISRVNSRTVEDMKLIMNDPTNWVGLVTQFNYERALSDYIAAYPHRLEDGLLPHPNERIRERVFNDRSRLDVLLSDRSDMPVIVECKQSSPTLDNLEQIRHYMEKLRLETNKSVRGILVHGGSKKLAPGVAEAAKRNPLVEIVQYTLDVDFSHCE